MLPWLIICLAVFLIGLTKSGLGAGMGLIVVPMTAIALDYTPMGSKAALGLLLPLLILGDIISLTQYRRIYDFSRIRALILPTFLGICVGSLLLFLIHHQDNERLIASLMRLEIGCESIFLVGLHWWRLYRGTQQKLLPEPGRSWLTGSFIGVSTTLAHAAGPIMASYLLPLKLDRRVFVGTTAVFFFMANSSKLPTYYLAGQFAGVDWVRALELAPLVFAGAIFGFWLIRKLSDQGFFRFVYIAVFLMGWYLVVESVMTLTGMR
jgi:uncharacterized membrane protein YfcA